MSDGPCEVPKDEQIVDLIRRLHASERERDALRARCEAAEAEVERHRDEHGSRSGAWADMHRRALAAESQRDRAVEVLRSVEWSHTSTDDPGYCRICEANFPVHAPDCRLARVLSGEKEGAP